MTISIINHNQTVSRTVYGFAIREACKIVPEEFILSQQKRIDAAYLAGEPVWMIVDEIALRWIHRPKSTKTPRELAKRIVNMK